MTKIEWTDETWNPIRGCSRVSEGCRNCYAEKTAYRFSGPGKPYEGLVQLDSAISRENAKRLSKWNGKIKFVEEHLFDPLLWKKPRRIFVNSMSDLFHENVTDEMRDKIFAVMALSPQHTFQVLTKRPERMLAYLEKACGRIADLVMKMRADRGDRSCIGPLPHITPGAAWWPLANVWLGVSVEDQKAADTRLGTLAMLGRLGWRTMVSFEPLLGSVTAPPVWLALGPETWAIVGGESGRGARPMHPDWARSLRDQCVAAGMPFFFKQWGEWGWEPPIRWTATPDMAGQLYGPFRPTCGGPGSDKRLMCRAYPAKIPAGLGGIGDRVWVMLEEAHRVGKKAAGHLLDGKEWHQFPEVER